MREIGPDVDKDGMKLDEIFSQHSKRVDESLISDEELVTLEFAVKVQNLNYSACTALKVSRAIK